MKRSVATLAIVGLYLLISACAQVDTILLTSETFPPKRSTDEVAVLAQKPTRPYLEIAELRIGDSALSFGSLQRKILSRAATLGADAVVFGKPQTQTTHEVAYEPAYNPWGYYSPYYGTLPSSALNFKELLWQPKFSSRSLGRCCCNLPAVYLVHDSVHENGVSPANFG